MRLVTILFVALLSFACTKEGDLEQLEGKSGKLQVADPRIDAESDRFDNDQPKKREGCVCAKIYQPVCGENGMTYGNSCEAECEGVKVVSEEACETTYENAVE